MMTDDTSLLMVWYAFAASAPGFLGHALQPKQRGDRHPTRLPLISPVLLQKGFIPNDFI